MLQYNHIYDSYSDRNEYFAGHVDCHQRTYSTVRGEFCTIRTITGCYNSYYGYTLTGFSITNLCTKIPQSDFQTFIREISDSGTSIFTRKLTTEEKIFLSLKYGYPPLQDDLVEEYFTRVQKTTK